MAVVWFICNSSHVNWQECYPILSLQGVENLILSHSITLSLTHSLTYSPTHLLALVILAHLYSTNGIEASGKKTKPHPSCKFINLMRTPPNIPQFFNTRPPANVCLRLGTFYDAFCPLILRRGLVMMMNSLRRKQVV